ncbi:MAG: SRPBCC family protein [Roseitalea sp.]|nr:SRPBCC family protein [Roseitalea sp.]MBO6721034.1 SRPBCC family protein [Roseitalea sp.]MBO6742894.1 SRPBCC family protein [Roseitalea sp.]
MKRTYSTTQVDLWSAVTEEQRLKRWFGEVSGEFRLGGRFSIEGNADGEIKVCEPPSTLSLTWEFAGNTSWVTVTMESAEEGTLLTLEHELPTDRESEAHWDKYGPGATGVGWELAILGMDRYLHSDGRSVIEAGQVWAEGEAGKDRLRSWAKAWGEAHMQDGTPRQVAMQTAQRTANFYTGEG